MKLIFKMGSMIEIIILLCVIISIVFPPLGIFMMQLLSMPIKIAFSDIRITGTLFSVLIILISLGFIDL